MKRTLGLISILLFLGAVCLGQQRQVTINSGDLLIPGNVGVHDFRVTLDQNVTSFEITGPRPDANNVINVLFVQDATGGRTVTGYASNLINTSDISIASAANAATLVKFWYSQIDNQWLVTSGGAHTAGTVAKVDLTGSTSNVALNTLYTPATSGCYKLSANTFLTSLTDYSTLEIDYEFTQNGIDSGAMELGFDSVNSNTEFANFQKSICADAGTPIKWALTFTGGAGDSYDVHVRLEKLN